MQNIQQIENWIEAIESSNLSKKEQEQRITALVDLWKFASCHNTPLKIGEMPNLLLHQENESCEEINVQCENLYIRKQDNITKKIFAEIEDELNQDDLKYRGVYRLQMNKIAANFNNETIQEVKHEIIAAIKGEVILYKHVLSLQKMPSSKVEIIALNFTILECTQNAVQEKIRDLKIKNFLFSPGKKWLVLFLNTLDNDCNYFSFSDELQQNASISDFDKLFLFDFYKGQVMEVKTKRSQVKVKVLINQKEENL